MTQGNSTNRFAVSNFIVAPTFAEGSTHTTFTSALADASSGDTIFVKDGTYVENPVFKAGVNIVSFSANAFVRENATDANVIIEGKCTATFAGSCSISGICFKTNGDYCLSITGSAATKVNLVNCYVLASDNDAVQFTSSAGAKLSFFNTMSDFGTTGLKLFTHSSAGSIKIHNSNLLNNAANTTDSTVSAGGIQILNSFVSTGFTTSGTGTFELNGSDITQALTCNSTGSHTMYNSHIIGGSNPAVTIGASASVRMASCSVDSTNTNAITGAGELIYTGLSFSNTSSNVNVTTQTLRNMGSSLSVGSANTGATNTFTVANTSNTASSAVNNQLTVGGGTAGDVQTTYTVTGAQSYSMGIDNGSSDNFVVAASTGLGTTDVMNITPAGEITKPLQPAFLAYLGTTDSNVTGNGALYTLGGGNALTEVFDQGSDFVTTGTFTAPVAGRFCFNVHMTIGGSVASTNGNLRINTSNVNYVTIGNGNPTNVKSSGSGWVPAGTVFTDMDAADTCVFNAIMSGESGDICDITAGNAFTYCSGYLVC